MLESLKQLKQLRVVNDASEQDFKLGCDYFSSAKLRKTMTPNCSSDWEGSYRQCPNLRKGTTNNVIWWVLDIQLIITCKKTVSSKCGFAFCDNWSFKTKLKTFKFKMSDFRLAQLYVGDETT